MRHIFGIRRDERWVFLAGLFIALALNALMVQYNYELFTRGGKLGYWGLFYNHFMVSGYDVLTYITLSSWNIFYTLYRHPLLALLMYPLYRANQWQMGHTEMNMAVFMVAALLVVCDAYSFLFMYRICREFAELRKGDAWLVSLLFFSFGHIMVAAFVPDHFGLSMFLLLLTLYVAGSCLRRRKQPGALQAALLYMLTAGVTLTNGVKVLLALLFTDGRRLFGVRRLLVVAVLPTLLLAVAYFVQHETIVAPNEAKQQARLEQKMKQDTALARKIREHREWVDAHKGEQLSENTYFQWTDISTSRWEAAVENLFGESIQLHRQHLLQDTNRNRPNYVAYDWALNYAVEAVLVFLFAMGAWCGRHNRFLQLCLSWFAFDMLLHMVLGFGILEVYIMAAHWLFVVPICIAFLLKSLHPRFRAVLRVLLIGITAYLWAYNGTLVTLYMLHLPV